MMLQGVVDAAVRRVELGAAEHPERIVDAAVAMVLHGVTPQAAPGEPVEQVATAR
jgi:hypothetical protein